MENELTPIFCNNNSVIALSKNHVFHKENKQNATHFYFIQELVNNGDISLQFSRSRDELINIFTKTLRKNVFEFQRKYLNIVIAHEYNNSD